MIKLSNGQIEEMYRMQYGEKVWSQLPMNLHVLSNWEAPWTLPYRDLWRLWYTVQSLSYVLLFVTPWTSAHHVSLSITNSQSLLKLMSIELVNHRLDWYINKIE